MSLPKVGLILYPNFSPFHFSIPYMIFNMHFPQGRLFEVTIVSADGTGLRAERAMSIEPDGDLSLLADLDMIIVPSWEKLDQAPPPALIDALQKAYRRGACLVGLCYGAYALAYAGLLDGKRASTHWLAEADFKARFPAVKLDTNSLYVEDDRLITSAGTGAGLDCCLYLVGKFHGAKVANRVARVMVIPPHRQGGQAQFIEYSVTSSTKDAKISQLLDQLRQALEQPYCLDQLAEKTAMSRRTFTRHFFKATGMTFSQWLTKERLQRSLELLESSSLPIENIAESIGFQTPASFRQHFKQRYRVSPNAWRKTFQSGNELPYD
jgi:transcriptional regulator GlxA family with amidase domain